MNDSRSLAGPPFRLCQESTSRRRQPSGHGGQERGLEAWPTGQGDYALRGRDTYPIKDQIHAAGGRWDAQAKTWYVTKDQALALGATILVRVLRAPACCERQMDSPARGIAALATYGETLTGRMIVRFCPFCDSHLHEPVAIRDVIDTEELPELQAACTRPPWED